MSPIIASAATQYVAEYEVANDPALVEYDAAANMSDALIAEMARELNMRVEDTETLSAIAEKISMFAGVSGKTPEAIVEFLNGLNEGDMANGIQMFGRKIAAENGGFNLAAMDAKKAKKDSFEYGGKTFPVKEAQEAARRGDVGMFSDLIDSILNEEVDVEQAEVVMAVRSLADDVQSQIERISDMMNKDVPAIADQMRAEQGASQAQQFSDTMSNTLGTYLESAKACKTAIDSQVMSLSGEAPANDMTGLGDTGAMDAMDAPADTGDDLDLDAPADTNEPAASGPESEPLGRAEV
jgi:hypothetical protein